MHHRQSEGERFCGIPARDDDTNDPISERKWIGKMIQQLITVTALSGLAHMDSVDHIRQMIAGNTSSHKQSVPPVSS